MTFAVHGLKVGSELILPLLYSRMVYSYFYLVCFDLKSTRVMKMEGESRDSILFNGVCG